MFLGKGRKDEIRLRHREIGEVSLGARPAPDTPGSYGDLRLNYLVAGALLVGLRFHEADQPVFLVGLQLVPGQGHDQASHDQNDQGLFLIGKDLLPGGECLLFLENIYERLTIVTLSAEEYRTAMKEAAAAGIAGTNTAGKQLLNVHNVKAATATVTNATTNTYNNQGVIQLVGGFDGHED